MKSYNQIIDDFVESGEKIDVLKLSEMVAACMYELDAVEVIRCKDCKYAREDEDKLTLDGYHMYKCAYSKMPNHGYEFCSWGACKSV